MSYPDFWLICAPSEHGAAYMQPQQQCVAGTAWENDQWFLSLGRGSQPAIVVAYGPGPSRGGSNRPNVFQTPPAQGFTWACSSVQALGCFQPDPLGGCTKFDPLTEGEDWVG